jgi:hypothetical protein
VAVWREDLGHVREASIFVLAVQAIPVTFILAIKELSRRPGIRELTAVDQKYVKEAVVVVVQQGDPASHGFN